MIRISKYIKIMLLLIALLLHYASANANCPGGGSSRQENLGRLLLKDKYNRISCKYLGQPYNFAGNQAHTGIDYPASANESVYAPVSGVYNRSSTEDVYGSASYVILPNGKKLFIHHMKHRIYGYRDKGKKIGEIYQDHVHAELRVNYSGTSLVSGSGRSCGSSTCSLDQIKAITDDPSEVTTGDDGGEPPDGGSGNANISIDDVTISKSGENNFRHEFNVTAGTNFKLDIEVDINNKEDEDVEVDIYYYWDDDKNFSFKDSHLLGKDSNVDIDGDDDIHEHKRNIQGPTEPGNHYYYVYVVASGDTDKSNSNNSDEYGKIIVLPQPHADLIVQSPSVNDSALKTSQSFTIRTTVKNQGDGSSSSSTLHYYLSTDSIISTGDTQLATDNISALSPNGTSAQSASISAPSVAGTYWVGACVDSVSGESNTGNNCSSGVQIMVSNATYPDLIVQPPSVSDSTLTPTQLFIVNATVKNQGNGNSTNTTLRYYRSTNSTISTTDTQLSTDGVSALSPNGTSVESNSATAPSSTGTYWIGACVDSVSGESNSGNNCSSGVQITVSNPTYPDLIVQSLSVSDSTLTPSQSFTVNARVRNQGNGASSSTTLRYYRSTNSIITTSDTQISTDGISMLSPNGYAFAESDSITAPTTTGTYWIGACVGTVNGESNTGNNCSSGMEVTVHNPTHIDLIVQQPSTSRSSMLVNQSFIIRVIVKNQGSRSSFNVPLHYLLSSDSIISYVDSQLSIDNVLSLLPNNTSAETSTVTAPALAGIYWVGACVSSHTESNDKNNCSNGVQIKVIKEQQKEFTNIIPILQLLLMDTTKSD